MISAWVGVDAGATKTALRAELANGEIIDAVVPSVGWDAEPVESGAEWIDRAIRATFTLNPDETALAVGAQGLDSADVVAGLTTALTALGYARVRCVNDAALLVPAAGFERGLGIIAGTGAIGVGTLPDGSVAFAGGWGAIIGDDAGAAGIVREATKSALSAHDDGQDDDGLLAVLLDAFDVTDAERLARTVNDNPTAEHWGQRAPRVFEAADAGSLRARAVIGRAADHLALLVDQLVRRGAVGHDVVAAGSVILNQPVLLDAVRARLADAHPELALHPLPDAPVAGALALARRLS